MSREKLEQMTGMKGQNLSPGRPTGLWLGAVSMAPSSVSFEGADLPGVRRVKFVDVATVSVERLVVLYFRTQGAREIATTRHFIIALSLDMLARNGRL